MQNSPSRLAASGALVSLSMLVLALFRGLAGATEGEIESWLIMAPCGLGPAVWLRRGNLRRLAPTVAVWATACGLTAIIAYSLLLLLWVLPPALRTGLPPAAFQALVLVIGLMGAWILLSNWIRWRESLFPRWQAILGGIAGVGWMLTMAFSVDGWTPQTPLVGLCTLATFSSLGFWLVGQAVWWWQQPGDQVA